MGYPLYYNYITTNETSVLDTSSGNFGAHKETDWIFVAYWEKKWRHGTYSISYFVARREYFSASIFAIAMGFFNPESIGAALSNWNETITVSQLSSNGIQ